MLTELFQQRLNLRILKLDDLLLALIHPRRDQEERQLPRLQDELHGVPIITRKISTTSRIVDVKSTGRQAESRRAANQVPSKSLPSQVHLLSRAQNAGLHGTFHLSLGSSRKTGSRSPRCGQGEHGVEDHE